MKKISVLIVAICFLFCSNGCLAEEQVVDAGNEVCPVTGEKIDSKNDVPYEYQGKVYHFCCSMCVPQFKKNPEKYIEVINKEKAQ